MSSTLISIIISIAIVLVALISFFIGRKRGVQRTVLDMGLTFAMLILAFFLTPIITNAFMGIAVTVGDTKATIGTYLTEYFMTQKDYAVYIQNSTSLQTFINGILPAVASVLVFVVLCFVFKLVEHIIYKIIEKLAFKSKQEEEEEGLSRNKLGGGILSAVKTVFFMIIVFLPFTSLAGFVQQNFFSNYTEKPKAEASALTDTFDNLPSTSEISNNIPSAAKRAIAGYNGSIIGWVGNLFGLDDVCFDYLSNINVRGNNISIRGTTQDLLGFYDYVLDLYAEYKEEPEDFFKNLDYQKLDQYKNQLLNGGMFKGFVLNVVYDYSQAYDKVLPAKTVEEYGNILAGVKEYLGNESKPNETLLSDVHKFFDIVKSAGETGFLDDVNKLGENASFEDVFFLAIKDYPDTFVTTSVESIFKINVLRGTFPTVMEEVKNKLGEGDVQNAIKQTSGKITDWDQFIADMNSILADVSELYISMENAGVKMEDFFEDSLLVLKAKSSSIEPVFKTMGKILDKVNALELMKDEDQEKILNDVLAALGFGDLLDGIVAQGQTVTYTYAFNKFAPAMKYVLEYDVYDEVKAEDYVSVICKIADEMYKDSLKSHQAGEKTKQDKLEEVFHILYELPKFKEITIDTFKGNLSSFVDLDVLDKESTRSKELEYMTDILIQLAKNTTEVEGKDVSYLRFLLTDGNDFAGLIKDMDKTVVEPLLSPILKSNMTKKVCDTIFNTIADTFGDAIGKPVSIVYSNTVFTNDNPQVVEACRIFEKFIEVYNLGELSSVNDIGYTRLGQLLDLLKNNAYRNELFSNRTEGIFRSAFNALIESAEATYGEISFLKLMNKTNIYEIQFATLFSFVETMENVKDQSAENSEFVALLKDLVKEDVADKSAIIEDMLDCVTVDNYYGVKEILDKANDLKIGIDTTGTTINVGGEDKEISEGIETYEFNNSLSAEQTLNLRLGFKVLFTGA